MSNFCPFFSYFIDDFLVGITCLELVEKSGVFGPEESDIGNLEQSHGKTLQAQSESPTNLGSSAYKGKRTSYIIIYLFHPCFLDLFMKKGLITVCLKLIEGNINRIWSQVRHEYEKH